MTPSLANLTSTIENAKNVLGKTNSFAWEVFNKIDGKKTGPEIADLINKKPTNVTKMLLHLHNMGLLEENAKRGKAIIYKKIPEIRTLKSNSRKNSAMSLGAETTLKGKYSSMESQKSRTKFSVIEQIKDIGKRLGVENIDQEWIDALVILNFIETLCTKFLMDHGFTEDQVKNMKWDQKLIQVRDQLVVDSKAKNYPIRTSSLSFFRNYRDVRNEQDHHAHLASAKITKTDVSLLRKNLQLFINVVFVEPSKHQ